MKKILLILIFILFLLPPITRGETVKDNYFKQGNSYLAERRYKEAISEYKKSIKNNSSNLDAYHNIGYAYACLGKYRNAINYYEKALQVTPDDAATNYNLGVAYSSLGDYENAMQNYEKVLQIDPTHLNAMNNLGSIYTETGRNKKAVELLEKLLEIHPDDVFAYINLACANANLIQYAEAVKNLQKAIELNPNSILAYNNLSIAYDKLGELEKAREVRRIAEELSQLSRRPGFSLVKEPSKRISSMGLSILPPQGRGWGIIQEYSYGGICYGKVVNNPAHTLTCQIAVVPIEKTFINQDEFLEWVKHNHQIDSLTDRFKEQKYNYKFNQRFSSYCVEYDAKAIDREKKLPDGSYLILKMHGYNFIHPNNPKHDVQIWYSERSNTEDFSPLIRKVGEEFIANLEK